MLPKGKTSTDTPVYDDEKKVAVVTHIESVNNVQARYVRKTAAYFLQINGTYFLGYKIHFEASPVMNLSNGWNGLLKRKA